MKILVTGGMGYIGSHTCIQLMAAGMTPVILDNLSNSSAIVLARIEALTGQKPIFYQGDVRDRAILEKIFSEHKITSVIHFAGLK
ncbi:MAG: SDR family NAD(P)-dependent oxidoreductase, partial [Psychromonas sp.]